MDWKQANQAIKAYFHRTKISTPVVDGSIRALEVTTLCLLTTFLCING